MTKVATLPDPVRNGICHGFRLSIHRRWFYRWYKLSSLRHCRRFSLWFPAGSNCCHSSLVLASSAVDRSNRILFKMNMEYKILLLFEKHFYLNIIFSFLFHTNTNQFEIFIIWIWPYPIKHFVFWFSFWISFADLLVHNWFSEQKHIL